MSIDFEKLFQKSSKNIRQDLSIVHKAYLKLGLADSNSLNFLIAGTNGKGTTASFLWSMLSASGLKVGLFTSPHIFFFRERIRCSHKEVSDDLLSIHIERIKNTLGFHLYEALSFFEVTTLLALTIFKESRTDVNIIEVGLGGRLDATNIIDPIASCVVSIGFDHQQWLGSTIQEIAYEKLGIVRQNTPLFWGMRSDDEHSALCENVLRNKVAKNNLVLYRAGENFDLLNESLFIKLDSISISNAQLPSFFAKLPQILQRNFCLALSMFEWFKSRYVDYFINSEEISESLEKYSQWPPAVFCRFQTFKLAFSKHKKFKFILDCCHNLEALKSCYSTLVQKNLLDINSKITVVASFLSDKDYLHLLDFVSNFADPLYLVGTKSTRGLKKSHLEQTEYSQKYYKNFSNLWEEILLNEHNVKNTILVCGSIIGLSEIMNFFRVDTNAKEFSKDLTCYMDY